MALERAVVNGGKEDGASLAEESRQLNEAQLLQRNGRLHGVYYFASLPHGLAIPRRRPGNS